MKIHITTDFIRIGQLLKLGHFINSGGQAKSYLQNNEVFYKDEKILLRGIKIYADSVVWINDQIYQIVKKV